MAFMENGPFWHVCTDGTRMSDIFCTDDDFRQGMMALVLLWPLVSKSRKLTKPSENPAVSENDY